jgi:hypothetical protein
MNSQNNTPNIITHEGQRYIRTEAMGDYLVTLSDSRDYQDGWYTSEAEIAYDVLNNFLKWAEKPDRRKDVLVQLRRAAKALADWEGDDPKEFLELRRKVHELDKELGWIDGA